MVAADFKTRKKTLWLIVKAVVTALAVVMISRSVSWDAVLQTLANLQVKWFGLAIVIFLVAQIISSLRCLYVVRALGGDLDFLTSTRAHFIGLWFNQVLPTSLGGDVAKIAILKNRVGLSVGTRATVIDRVSGLMLLMFVLLIQLPLYAVYFDDGVVVSIGLIASVTLIGAIIASRIASSFNNVTLPFGVHHLSKLIADIWKFRKGRLLWEQFWTSLVVHINGIICFGLIGFSMGHNVDFILFLLAVPLVFLAALLPISFAGWGLREVGAILIFPTIGISTEGALGMSIGFGILLLIAGIPGLLYWVLYK